MSVLPTQQYNAEDTYVTQDNGVTTSDLLEIAPTRTWRFDEDTGRIVDVIDDEEALHQFIVKALRTVRYRYPIYDGQYGSEVTTLIGRNMSQALAESEVPRMIREALISDDRINAVTTGNLHRVSDRLYATVLVDSVYGQIESEVIL